MQNLEWTVCSFVFNKQIAAVSAKQINGNGDILLVP